MLALRERRTTEMTFWPRQLLALSSIGMPGIPTLQKCNLHPSTVTWDTTWRPHCIIGRFWWHFLGNLKKVLLQKMGSMRSKPNRFASQHPIPTSSHRWGRRFASSSTQLLRSRTGTLGFSWCHTKLTQKNLRDSWIPFWSHWNAAESWEFWYFWDTVPTPILWRGQDFPSFVACPPEASAGKPFFFKVPKFMETDWSNKKKAETIPKTAIFSRCTHYLILFVWCCMMYVNLRGKPENPSEMGPSTARLFSPLSRNKCFNEDKQFDVVEWNLHQTLNHP